MVSQHQFYTMYSYFPKFISVIPGEAAQIAVEKGLDCSCVQSKTQGTETFILL
jgi:hypothetical protein